MSEKFSSTVRISDINDFIAPSQGCIVSLKPIPTNQERVEKQVKVATSIKPLDTEETVKISLKDCLACSGCITSAETVMLEKQSLDEFLSSIESGKAVVVSLSPQSRASLAAHFGISPSQVFRKLTTFLKSLGVKVVFDTSCSRDLSLIEACNEFVARYNQSYSADGEASKTSLPMITSACPDFVGNDLEPAFMTHCLQTGVRLEGYNIPSIPGAVSQRDRSSDGSSLENVNNGPVVATEPYRVDCKRKRQAFGVYTDRNDNGGTVPKTTRTELADGLRPPREAFELPNEIIRNLACSNETQALGILKQEDYLVLPSEFSPPVAAAAGKVGSARVMEKFHPLFCAGVYVLNKRVVGNGEDAVKFGLARLEALMLGWYDKQREVRFEPIPAATAFDDMVADAEMIKKHVGVARLVAWIVPLCAEHTFRTQGHQFLSNLNAGYSAKYASLFKSCLVPEIDKFLPDGLMFHTAFHWISPRRVWEVLIANKDKDIIPEAIRLRVSDAPAGATIISTSRVLIDAMKPMALIAALEEHIVADLECIEAVDKEIRADPVKYHKVPSAYGLGPLPEEDLRVFERAKREAKNLAPVTKAFVDIMLSSSPMAKQKVLNKASDANRGLYKLVRKHLIEYMKATPTSLSQVFTNLQVKKVLVASPFENPLIKRLYEEWLDQPGSEKAKKFIHTEYHPMVKSITSQLHNW